MTGRRADEAPEWLSTVAHGERWGDHRAASIRVAARQTMSVGLAAAPESVRVARDFTGSVLRLWDLAAIYDDVRLVASELVTNALRYAVEFPVDCGDALPIRFSLLHADERLTCAVTDPSDRIPVHREPDFASQSGRGLHLVEAVSDTWNWAPLGDHGKVVWACFLCPDR